MDKHLKGKATADQLVFERVLAELIADIAPAKHVELLFERAKRLRKAGKPVEAFGSLKPLLRSRADLDAAIDDDQRFFLAQLSLEAVGEGLAPPDARRRSGVRAVRAARREGLPGREEARARTATSPTSSSTRSASACIESGDGSNEELGAELLAGHHRGAPAQQAREGGEEQAQAHRPPRRGLGDGHRGEVPRHAVGRSARGRPGRHRQNAACAERVCYRRGVRLAFALVCAVMTACYSPGYRDCEVTCTTGACPSGLSCELGYCRVSGATANCSAVLDDGGMDTMGDGGEVAFGTPVALTTDITVSITIRR